MAIDPIPARLLRRAATSGDDPAYFAKRAGTWQSTTWAEFGDKVRRAARALVALGFEPGDTTAILGFNTPEWVIFDVATMAAGGAPAGVYTTCSPPEVQYIVDHCEARVVLVENLHQWEKIRSVRDQLPHVQRVVLMDGAPEVDDELVLSWSAFLALADQAPAEVVDKRIDGLQADEVATFIYTSGTTGPPKAVMLTHRNLAWTADCSTTLADVSASDWSLSYLPLSHIAEQMFTIHVPITVGSAVYYAESLEVVADNLKEVQPTVVFGVPRIWEKMHAGASQKMREATGVKARILDFALRTGAQYTAARNEGRKPGKRLRLKHRIAERLVYSKVKPALGLGNARTCITGAAPIATEVLEFFAGLDLTIQEVYGQSEDTGPTSFNTRGHTRYGTVGLKLPGTEVDIADDGEIRVRGPHVFKGYFKDPEATAATLVDGWLHTGDLGAFDADGYLKITGRKKEIIITAGGKNIAPKNIEAALKNLPLVSQAVVIGDRRKYLAALVTLDPEAAAEFAREHGLGGAELHSHDAVRAAIQRGVDEEVNPQFARVEHVRRFTVLPRDFGIDEGELTPTLKIKRNVVHAHFADAIEAMYAEGERASA